MYNVVDYSATSFPCGVSVDKAVDQYASDYKAQSESCQAAYDSCKCHFTLAQFPFLAEVDD